MKKLIIIAAAIAAMAGCTEKIDYDPMAGTYNKVTFISPAGTADSKTSVFLGYTTKAAQTVRVAPTGELHTYAGSYGTYNISDGTYDMEAYVIQDGDTLVSKTETVSIVKDTIILIQ